MISKRVVLTASGLLLTIATLRPCGARALSRRAAWNRCPDPTRWNPSRSAVIGGVGIRSSGSCAVGTVGRWWECALGAGARWILSRSRARQPAVLRMAARGTTPPLAQRLRTRMAAIYQSRMFCRPGYMISGFRARAGGFPSDYARDVTFEYSCQGDGATALSVAVGKFGLTFTDVLQAFSMFCGASVEDSS